MKYKEQLKTREWKSKRLEVLFRDNNRCTNCGSSKYLQVHHLEYHKGKLAWGYDNSFLKTLCSNCHKKVHKTVESEEEFYLMYSSMVLILKGSTDVRMKLFASLLERYSEGQEFSMSKGLKDLIAVECKCSPRSFDTAFSSLVKDNIIVRLNRGVYKVNPRHVFKGSRNKRNDSLKAIIQLGCKNC